LGLRTSQIDAGARDKWLESELTAAFGTELDEDMTLTPWGVGSCVGAVRLHDVEGLTTFSASVARHPDADESRLPHRMELAGAVLPRRLTPGAYVAVVPSWFAAPPGGQYYVGPREFAERYTTRTNSESALYQLLSPTTVQRLLSLGDAIALFASQRWIIALSLRKVIPEARASLELVVVEAVIEQAQVPRNGVHPSAPTT
jgi:hypothetical protein